MKIYIKTYGCQMNERDSEAMAGMLAAAGHEIVFTEDEADVLLFNTCSVREQAERKAIGKIGYLRKLKLRKPGIVIGAVGCMAQRMGDKLLEKLPHLDFVLGTGQLHTVADRVAEVVRERRRGAFCRESGDVLTGMGSHFRTKGREWYGEIAITRGCNRFCSYCIVPYVRGREISREPGDVLDEARRLVSSGVRELLLLGQNVAAYGLGGDTRAPEPENSPFGELLEELSRIPELLRIRFTSPYPTYFNDRLIRAMASSPKICRNVHLPLQSGSDRVLRTMNRQYTADIYREVANKLRSAIPGITFSTDVIVGFPGETDDDFKLTRDLMNEIGFDNSFIFKYSPRPGAKSAAEPDSVPQEVKEERNRILLDDLHARVAAALKGAVGSAVEVLVEGVSPRNPARWCGRTDTNRMIHFEPDASVAAGTLRRVRIERAGEVSLSGQLLPLN